MTALPQLDRLFVTDAGLETDMIFNRGFSPGRRAGTVTVRLREDGEGSVVDVAYDITALGPEGEQAVKGMDEAGFAAMLGEWERLIRGALKLP
jgi:hypothetical protein